MAKGDYYFPLYYKRLLASTVGWTDAEFGTYLRLLIHQFDNGFIPNDLNKLARIAPSVKKNWHIVSEKFTPKNESELINEVMDDIYKEVQSKKERNQVNGNKGGRPRKVDASHLRFYLIECFNSTERFFKPGITSDTIKQRYGSTKGCSFAMPYEFKIHVDIILPQTEGLQLESQLVEKFKKYVPMVKFSGHTECIEYDLNVLNFIFNEKPYGFKKETQTKAIPIINNQQSIIKDNTDTPGSEIKFPITRCLQIAMMDHKWVKANSPTQADMEEFMTMLTGTGEHEKNPADFKSHFFHWKKKQPSTDQISQPYKRTIHV